MEIQKLKALKEERFFKARNLNGGARTNRLQNNGLFAPSRLFALDCYFGTETIQDSKKCMYTAIACLPLLTIKNIITEARLLK